MKVVGFVCSNPVLSMALRGIKKLLKPLKDHQFLFFLPPSEKHLFLESQISWGKVTRDVPLKC